MKKFTVTYQNLDGKQFTRTTTAEDAKQAVEKIRIQQLYTPAELRAIVSVKEWTNEATGGFIPLDQLRKKGKTK